VKVGRKERKQERPGHTAQVEGRKKEGNGGVG
jgi:hypothetical protein